jgi:nicotinic acid phosphoribosyltransferase
MSVDQPIDTYHRALFTDLYELSMMQAYYADDMTATAVFELYFRELPTDRNYVMVAGLDDVLQHLETLHISDDEVAWLCQLRQFDEKFLQQLCNLRFTGDVHAMPEGTLVFENEPVLQVVAPLPEAQFIETYVLNQIHVQSVAASKAARIVTAAQGRQVVDYNHRPRLKLSTHKRLLPGRKQVFRIVQDGRLLRDVVGQHGERLDGEALLRPVMRHGKRLEAGRVPLAESREHTRAQLQALPPELRHLRRVHPGYRVDISAALQAMADALQGELHKQRVG